MEDPTATAIPDWGDDMILPDLFIEQAKRTPQAIAVVDGNVEWTYQQLDQVTDQLAVELVQEYGVRPDSVVGILLPRSLQYVVAYVSILKAGGAYMPLELVYPKALLERAVLETASSLVLTNAQYASRIADATCPHMVLGDAENMIPVSKTNIVPFPPPRYQRPNADHLAFCVMSSGTTGAPKGICQTHRAAVHSYMDRWHRFPYVAGDRVGAGVFFVWELYRPLCRGATCVVIPDHVLFDPPSVTSFVQEFGITRILFTPSLLQLLLDSLDHAVLKERLCQLRYLWLCGEVVSRDLAQAFCNVLPEVELMNLYSISECHDVSIGDLRREFLWLEQDVPSKYATCGTAIPGVQFYIVDLESKTMKQVPSGETGEVYVGGPVVGRGYLNMPEKTAERFVDNPFPADVPNCQRLYRTGDLGRLLPNGQLEILGRCDFMVKIRGYSVVLGAIETALGKHPKLSSAVVLAVGQEGAREGKKLVAYVVPTDWHDAPSASSVRNFLKEHVPPYAIPSVFCVINALPVAATAAGKLDRKKLPDVDQAQRLRAFSMDGDEMMQADKENTQRLAPQNATEQGILDIWCQLLEIAPAELSALDSFFEVGGHSLLATKLVALVNEKFGKTTDTGLSIVQVVEAPTIREMANQLLRQEKPGQQEANKVRVDLLAEAEALDPSIYPFPTRKGNTMARFRLEAGALMHPRVVFLTGATGYLGAHILAQLLQQEDITVIALARANDDAAAKNRVVQTLQKYKLLVPQDDDDNDRLIAVAGDLSQPLLGMDQLHFKSLALEIDSIIHCGAEVNLIKPYASLKASNVLGTQEILRLATTNGFVKTKVKPVHYISTNGIFPVEADAYPDFQEEDGMLCVKEDVELEKVAQHLSEGYAMSKLVAEQMCTIAEARGLPVSVLQPGNMAGSSITGVQNPDDLNFLLLEGILRAGCAPVVGTNYALDLTPVNFAAQAVVQLAVHAPQAAIGQRLHLQSPQKPVALTQVVEWLRNDLGYDIQDVTKEEWVQRIASNEKLASGWASFAKYFEASTWLTFGSNNLQQALSQQPSNVTCPPLDAALLEQWFGKSA